MTTCIIADIMGDSILQYAEEPLPEDLTSFTPPPSKAFLSDNVMKEKDFLSFFDEMPAKPIATDDSMVPPDPPCYIEPNHHFDVCMSVSKLVDILVSTLKSPTIAYTKVTPFRWKCSEFANLELIPYHINVYRNTSKTLQSMTVSNTRGALYTENLNVYRTVVLDESDTHTTMYVPSEDADQYLTVEIQKDPGVV